MIGVALKMLIGNRASFIGVVFGIFLATLLISQQSAIFLGLVSRSYRLITDTPSPDIWVIDPVTKSDDKIRELPESYVDVIRSIPNIEWAVPLNIIGLPLITPSGVFQISELHGIDGATFIGAPLTILQGSLKDLRRQGAVMVDEYSANSTLAKTLPDKSKSPLKIGDSFEINGRRAVVVGICKATQGFYPHPVIYTTNQNYNSFTGNKNKVGFIAAKAVQGADIDELCRQINKNPQLTALTRNQIEWRIAKYFLETGILINFGLSVLLGLIIGLSISGQIFYIMTLQNQMYFALIRALGGTKATVLKMISVQALVVGLIGFILGTGVTLVWGFFIQNTTLAFLFPWQLLLFTGFIVLIICLFTASLSIRKVLHLEPKALMGT